MRRLERGVMAGSASRHVLKRTDMRQRLAHDGWVGSWIAFRPVFGREPSPHLQGRVTMLYTIAVILLIAWLLGIVGTYTIGAFVHVLLVVAIVLFVVGLLTGRRTVV